MPNEGVISNCHVLLKFLVLSGLGLAVFMSLKFLSFGGFKWQDQLALSVT